MSPTSQPIASVSPAEVRALLGDGAEMALIDVREEGVFSEEGHPFFANSVPLSRLELMIRDLVPRQSTRIVVHDGGGEDLAERAAAKLAQMEYGNLAIMAGGAQAWAAAGFELFTGINVPSKAFGELVEHRCETPHIAAGELKRRLDAGEEVLIVDSRPIGEFGIVRIDDAMLARFLDGADARTLYLFDVRSPEEYAAGHLAAARSAPGGQLVQATDVYMATRNARIVLVDDDGVRAVMTGSWLAQMGWPEVYVLEGGLAGRGLVRGIPGAVIPEVEG